MISNLSTIMVFLILLLTGCISKNEIIMPTKPVDITNYKVPPLIPLTPIPETVPQLPNLNKINWYDKIQPLIFNMINSVNVIPKSILLVDYLKNNTNGTLQTDKVTWIIKNNLATYSKFILVSRNQLNQAKQLLGLSPDDMLNSRSKMLNLARVVNAQYLLFINAQGVINSPIIKMQLVLVKTGEIIWSNN